MQSPARLLCPRQNHLSKGQSSLDGNLERIRPTQQATLLRTLRNSSGCPADHRRDRRSGLAIDRRRFAAPPGPVPQRANFDQRQSAHRRPPDSTASAPRNRDLHHGQNHFGRTRQSLSPEISRRRSPAPRGPWPGHRRCRFRESAPRRRDRSRLIDYLPRTPSRNFQHPDRQRPYPRLFPRHRPVHVPGSESRKRSPRRSRTSVATSRAAGRHPQNRRPECPQHAGQHVERLRIFASRNSIGPTVLMNHLDLRRRKLRTVLATFLAIAAVAPGVWSQKAYDPGASTTEIKIGNIAPYTGWGNEYAAVARAGAAYFQMINDRGGINGRKINFITLDSASEPSKALPLARKLVEEDKVLLIFSSIGTEGNLQIPDSRN